MLRRNLAPLLLVLTVSSVVANAADAQVSARQGTEDERTRFESPMILDLPLTLADRELWGKGPIRSSNETALRKYSCEGVSIVDFAGGARRHRDGTVTLTFDFMLMTEPGMDKLASIRAVIMDGDREVASGSRPNLDAEEGKRVGGQIVIRVREESLTAEPRRTLRITLKVRDNP